jgi:predicted nucleic acid-binding protein
VKSILIDIDIILDVLTKREPFFAPAANLWAKVEKKSIRAYLASHAMTCDGGQGWQAGLR